jgi:hypothetical protein
VSDEQGQFGDRRDRLSFVRFPRTRGGAARLNAHAPWEHRDMRWDLYNCLVSKKQAFLGICFLLGECCS